MTSKSSNTNVPAGSEEKSMAAKVVETSKSAAKSVTAQVVDQAQAGTEAAKNGVADEVSMVASALRNAAQDMRNGSPQERTIGQIAESLADASDAIRDKDLVDVVHDVGDVARRNPALFLGGAALLGFVATRFAKAGRPRSATASSQTDDFPSPSRSDDDAPPHAMPSAASSSAHPPRTGGAA